MFGKPTGMDFGAVTAATCLSAALATAIMALYARYPIAQAPGMGENFFFVFSAIPAAAAAGFANAWEVALGVVFVAAAVRDDLSQAQRLTPARRTWLRMATIFAGSTSGRVRAASREG